MKVLLLFKAKQQSKRVRTPFLLLLFPLSLLHNEMINFNQSTTG